MRKHLMAAVAAAVVGLVTNGGAAAAKDRSDVLLILDASGSMWGQVAGEAKITIARRVLKDVAGKIPAGTEVGLVAYGHRSEGDCNDIETVMAFAPLDASALGATVDKLNAKGKTPITKAVEHAVGVLKPRDRAATVILVSDGLETCGGDPCAAVRAAKESGITFVMHVVGFDMGDADVSQLECAAQAGGGLYFDAKNADELAGALDQALEAPLPEEKAARLSVKATANGKPIDATVLVTAPGAAEPAAAGRTYTAADTNPRILPLDPGTYDVAVTGVGLKGEPRQSFAGVAVKEGATTELVADFSTGKLAVKVTRNGALSDATVSVFRPGTTEHVANGRTYTAAAKNPTVLAITAGSYDVRVEAIEIADKPRAELPGVAVDPGKRVDLVHDFPSGTLKIGATHAGALQDATVNVRRAGTRESVASGRTYADAKTNPKAFELSPGAYEVDVAPVKPPGAAKKTVAVTITAGASTEQVLAFP